MKIQQFLICMNILHVYVLHWLQVKLKLTYLLTKRIHISFRYGFKVLLAATIPQLGLFISLISALCLSTLAIAFPAIIDICVLHSRQQLTISMIMIDGLLIVFGLTALIVGTFVCVRDIIATF